MANGHRDLEVWQMGMDLVVRVYKVSEQLPDQEKYGLVSQMKRSAVSIPSNIAEGWNRGTQPNLVHFTRISRGSLAELDTLVDLSLRLGFISDAQWNELSGALVTLGKKLFSFLRSVESSYVRETAEAYNEFSTNLED